MRWFSIFGLEIGFKPGRLIVSTSGKVARVLIDRSW